jgi:heat shock protein HslJ
MLTLKSMLVALALIAGVGLTLVGCQPAEPTAMPEPVAEPTEAMPEPVIEPTLEVTTSEAMTSPLQGPIWSLVSHGDPMSPTLTLTDTRVTASFDGTTVTGTGGCNNYFASYTVDGDSLTIQPGAGSSMMACDEPVMAQETAYLMLLNGAASFAVEADALTITTADGMVLNYMAEPQMGLDGTSWTLVNFNNGQEAVVGLAEGSAITATFSAGQITGFGGCNNYFADYTVDGDGITIGPAGSTRMACEPPEVMEQEQQYFAALETAATWSINGTRLEMRTAADAMAVLFDQVMTEEAAPTQ